MRLQAMGSASFLLGYPWTAFVDETSIPPSLTSITSVFPGRLENKPAPHVELGLRWDYESPATERYDRMVRGLDFDAASPIASGVQGLPRKALCCSPIKTASRGAPSHRTGTTSLPGSARHTGLERSGYFAEDMAFTISVKAPTGYEPGYSQRTNAVTTVDNLKPAVTLNNAFALLPGVSFWILVGNANGASSFLGQALTANWIERPLPYSHQYSFDIQREFAGGILIEAGYVGNLTRKLPINTFGNYVPASELGRRTASGALIHRLLYRPGSESDGGVDSAERRA